MNLYRLYHFTRPQYLDSILRDGLRASLFDRENKFFSAPAVWLTADPSPHATSWYLSLGSTVCLQVNISPNSRRLIHYQTLLRSNAHKDLIRISAAFETSPDWWLYRGDIKTGRLSLFPARPHLLTRQHLTGI